MRTALIFAHECAPYNRPESTVGAQRPAQFARHLPEFGWRAIVLCRDHGASGSLDAAGVQQRVERRLRAASADASVVIALPARAEEDWFERTWGRAAARGGDGLRAIPRKALTLARFFVGDYSRGWRSTAEEAARHVRAQASPEVCIGEHSPDAGLFLARWYARETGVPWVMDFRDPILFGYPPRTRPLLAPFARRALRGAARIVTVTPACQEIDRRMFDAPVEMITNGFDPEEFEALPPYQGNEALTVVYTGGIWVEKPLRVFFEGFARALHEVPPGTLRFRYRGGSHELVAQAAREAAVLEACDVRGQVGRAAALALTKTADLLLLFAPGDHPDPYWKRGVYPGKTFEYFGSGRPILCVPGDRGILDDLLAETGTGVVARGPTEVCAQLLSAWKVWQSTGVVPSSPNDAALERYTRHATVQRLAALLDDVAGRVAPLPVAAVPTLGLPTASGAAG